MLVPQSRLPGLARALSSFNSIAFCCSPRLSCASRATAPINPAVACRTGVSPEEGAISQSPTRKTAGDWRRECVFWSSFWHPKKVSRFLKSSLSQNRNRKRSQRQSACLPIPPSWAPMPMTTANSEEADDIRDNNQKDQTSNLKQRY